jgi:hypothetical protein
MCPIPQIVPNPAALAAPRCVHTGGVGVTISSQGTDSTPVVTETYIAEVYIPETMVVTGIAPFNGSVVTNNKHFAYLCDAAGALIPGANTAPAGTTTAGIDSFQRIPLVAPITLPRGTYYVCLQMDGTTDRFNTHPIGNFGASKRTSTVFGTAIAVTPPTTFTAGQGPIASLY